MKMYYLVILSTLFFSCGVFKSKQENYQKIDEKNVRNLNGNYSIFSSEKRTSEYPYVNNANEKFYRKYGRRASDTIKFTEFTGGNFKIVILENRRLKIDFFKKDQIVKSQILRYKFKKDGFLYIRNRITIIAGVPYILGGIDVKKIRIALGENNDLIINDVFDSSGALLLIFGDAKVWEETNSYKRIE